MAGARGSDIPNQEWPIIIVMGQSGCGKSTFIETAGPALADKPQVGSKMESCTTRVKAYTVENPYERNKFVILIDTPGFNDSDGVTTDKERLDSIALQLKENYGTNTIFHGVIYLQEISDVRPQKHLLELVGSGLMPPPFPVVSFVTTKWHGDGPTGQRPECEAQEPKLPINIFERPQRFYRTLDSAWEVINKLCACSFPEWPVFILLGQTGCGKSTFVEKAGPLTKKPEIGHGVDACTTNIEAYIVKNPKEQNKYAIIIDTPGFDGHDTTSGDQRQLKSIATWLRKKFGPNTGLRGIIYLHAINRKKLQNNPVLVGPRRIPSPPGISLVTTQWCNQKPTDQPSEYNEHESRLPECVPSRTRFYNTADSAWEILNGLCASSTGLEMDKFAGMLHKIGTDLGKPGSRKLDLEKLERIYARLVSAFYHMKSKFDCAGI